MPAHQRERGVGNRHVFGLRDLAQASDDLAEGHELDVVALHATQDGRGQLLRIGGRKEELDVAGRLFQRLEQRVEGRAGEHVHFVDDVDLVAIARGQVPGGLAQRPHVVDAVVGGGIDLLHVDVGAGGDVDARPADTTRLRRRALLAIQGAREDAGAGRLAAAARAGEEERVRDAPRLERVDQRPDDVLLTGQIAEPLWSIFSGEDEIRGGHRCLWPAACSLRPVA